MYTVTISIPKDIFEHILEAQTTQKVQQEKINTISDYFYFDEINRQLMEKLYESFEHIDRPFKHGLFRQNEKASSVYIIVDGEIECAEVKYSLNGPILKNRMKDRSLQQMVHVPKELRESTTFRRIQGVGTILGVETFTRPGSREQLYVCSATVYSETATLLRIKTEVG